jgi:hypothetical protein
LPHEELALPDAAEEVAVDFCAQALAAMASSTAVPALRAARAREERGMAVVLLGSGDGG